MRLNQTAWKNASSTFSTLHLYPPRMLIHLQLRLSFRDVAACKRVILFDLKLEFFFHRSKHSASYCSLALLLCLGEQGGIVDLGWLFTPIGQYHVQAFYIQKLHAEGSCIFRVLQTNVQQFEASSSSTALTKSVHGAEVKLSYRQADSSLLSHHVPLRANNLQVSLKTIITPEHNADELLPSGQRCAN